MFSSVMGLRSTALLSVAAAVWVAQIVVVLDARRSSVSAPALRSVVSLWANGLQGLAWSGLGLFAGVFPGLYWAAGCALIGPVVLYEGRGLRRAAQLAEGRRLLFALYFGGLFAIFVGYAVVCDVLVQVGLPRVFFAPLLCFGACVPLSGSVVLYDALVGEG